MAIILKLRASMLAYPRSTTSRRLHLTAGELAVCGLRVRLTRLWDRRKCFKTKLWNYPPRLKRLSVKLERLRKVAKRLHVRSRGKADYDEVSRSWQRHIQWMRATFFFVFFLHLPPLPYRRIIARRRIYADWVESVKKRMRDLTGC